MTTSAPVHFGVLILTCSSPNKHGSFIEVISSRLSDCPSEVLFFGVGLEPTTIANYIFSHSSLEIFLMSETLVGNPSALHHFRIALSETPYCSPILTNGLFLIKVLSSSLLGLLTLLCYKPLHPLHIKLFSFSIIIIT